MLKRLVLVCPLAVSLLGGTVAASPQQPAAAANPQEEADHEALRALKAVYEQAVSEFVEAPPEQRIFCGVALGHADLDHPINSLVSGREPLDVFARFL